jgi:hypothetical protein
VIKEQDLLDEAELSIEQLLEKISKSPFNHMVWIGKNFSIKDLRDTLTEIKKGLH